MLLIRVSSLISREPETVYEHVSGAFELGREARSGTATRCVIKNDQFMSHDHARIEECNDGQVRITNISTSQPVRIGGDILPPGKTRLVYPPVRLTIGTTKVGIEPAGAVAAGKDYVSLHDSIKDQAQPLRLADLVKSPDPGILGAWFEAVIEVTRAAAGSNEFFQHTAEALVKLVALDVGLVLLRNQTGWVVAARATGPAAARLDKEREYSLTILSDVVSEKRTLYQAGPSGKASASLMNIESLIASPIFSPAGEVIGAVYGARWFAAPGVPIVVGPLEAQMVQVLATAAGVGLARAEKEAEAARMHVQFRQYFSDQLARELEQDAGKLEGKDREITVLFADIRGFSRLSEKLGARDTFRLVSDTMEALTEAVHAYDGVVMDYVGDELIGIWNAPVENPDHPRMAAECAAAIPRYLERMNTLWLPVLGEPVRVGVGINTGMARVGNTGTRYKFKYGALGHTVNMASRIQGATKAFKVSVLVSGSTRVRLTSSGAVRRLGMVRVVGINQPVELHELAVEPNSAWNALRASYESALGKFESGDFAGASTAIQTLLETRAGQADGATQLLASRLSAIMASATPTAEELVIELSQK